MDTATEHRTWINLKTILKERLSITQDMADDEVIDERIRSEVEMRGATLWILMFAIFVASIGLNVNSTAVIIGAMLISPLMGPIMGIGYGAGINDFSLLRRSFVSLSFATMVGLLTSTLYFLISPLDTAHSELLARTTPTAWDVLIGLFGGLAGIVAITRKEKSNVIPGVAIATALMPPLCTAGFGLSSGNWEFFLGAFYLYTINFVFIALASFIVVRAFNVAEKKYVDPALALKAQRYIAAAVLITLLPSSYLAYRLVGEEVFKARASQFVAQAFNFKTTNVAQVKIDPKNREIKVFLIGEYVPQEKLNEIRAEMGPEGLGKASLNVYQNTNGQNIDLSKLKTGIITDLYHKSQIALQSQSKEIEALKEQLRRHDEQNTLFESVPAELKTLFPKIREAILSKSYDPAAVDENRSSTVLVLNVQAVRQLSAKERRDIEAWLKIRAKHENVLVLIR
ncbi:DUF389 domain-containing protein [Sulfuricurvum sp. IAE1]|uniref:DUF389 domain-containing protein n=1 Tax=Sulfuricurvum sp. IAE1 TaxID=2546102 RepID=UPI001051C11A|nr:DUF389 domain-containing protein [Sulfuricurvum sp. IAE1]TDA62377.1 DUF389 domain-containing protein [Sulfuricurvum sp. IAE1]